MATGQEYPEKTAFYSCSASQENNTLFNMEAMIMTSNTNHSVSSEFHGTAPDIVSSSFSLAPSASFSSKDVRNSEVPQGNTLLLIGDDNFTFTPCFLESRHFNPASTTIEVTSCLSEDKIPNDFRPNYLTLISQGVTIHFGINPAQLRNNFFHNQYSQILFILPGIAFSGFPEFLDKQHDPLFRLRLHIFAFSFLKSSKNALRQDALVQFLWPRQNSRNEFLNNVPWHNIEIGKIGPFCEIFRSLEDDDVLDAAAFNDWHPLIHNIPQTQFPSYLHDSVFYSWRLSSVTTHAKNDLSENKFNHPENEDVHDDKDCNLLFVPPGLWSFSVETLSHVNELFKFEMKTYDDGIIVVSKPTLKFDPRFRSDGIPAKNPFMKYSGKMRNHQAHNYGAPLDYFPRSYLCPPPPPPPDCPTPFYGDSMNPGPFLTPAYGYPPHDLMMTLLHEQHPRWLMQQRAAWASNERMMFHDNSGVVELGGMSVAPYCQNSVAMDPQRYRETGSGYDEVSFSKALPAYQTHNTEEQNYITKSAVPSHEDVLLYESLEQGPYTYTDPFIYEGCNVYNDYLSRGTSSSLPHQANHAAIPTHEDQNSPNTLSSKNNEYYDRKSYESTGIDASRETSMKTGDLASSEPGHSRPKSDTSSQSKNCQTTSMLRASSERQFNHPLDFNERDDETKRREMSKERCSSRTRNTSCHLTDYTCDERKSYLPLQTRSLSPQCKENMVLTTDESNVHGLQMDQLMFENRADVSHTRLSSPVSRINSVNKISKAHHPVGPHDTYSSPQMSEKYSSISSKRNNSVQHCTDGRLPVRRARQPTYAEGHCRQKVMVRHMHSCHKDTSPVNYSGLGHSSSYRCNSDDHSNLSSYDNTYHGKAMHLQANVSSRGSNRRTGSFLVSDAPRVVSHSPGHTYGFSKRNENLSSHVRKITFVKNHYSRESSQHGSKYTHHLREPPGYPKSTSRYERSRNAGRNRH